MSYTKVSDNKYRIFVSAGKNLDGSRRRFSKTITTNLKGRDLERFLTLKEFDFEDEINRKNQDFSELANDTLENYARWWLNYKSEIKEIEDTTREYYEKRINDRIIPFAGNNTLNKLTQGDMLELIRMIKESPAKTKNGKLSQKSIKHYHTILSAMFSDAVKLKILTENIMDNVTVKSSPVKVTDNFYNFEDIKKLIQLLDLHADTKHQLAIMLTIATGLRVGELTGLTWGKIDLYNKTIKIDQANAYTATNGSYIKNTKNQFSERTIAFPTALIPLFKSHEESELLKKELLGSTWQGSNSHEDDFVFTQENGKAMFVGSIPKWFRKFIKRHGLKHITFHGLRHTNSTVLIASGVNVVSISHNLGHARTSTTTDLYSHHLQSVEQSMANVFQEIIVNGSESGSQNEKIRLAK